VSVKEIIAKHTFFQTLNAEQLEMISSFATLQQYEKEYILCYEQDKTADLCFLVSGLAKAYKLDKHDNEIFLYYIYENSMLSEFSTLESLSLHSFSNISFVEDSQVLKINYKKFKELFLDKEILCQQLNSVLLERVVQMHSLINREFILDAVSKVSMMLHNDLKMFNKLKRHDIALMLHIQPATLSRVLNRLKRKNIIDIIHGKVDVLDAKALEEIYRDKVDE